MSSWSVPMNDISDDESETCSISSGDISELNLDDQAHSVESSDTDEEDSVSSESDAELLVTPVRPKKTLDNIDAELDSAVGDAPVRPRIVIKSADGQCTTVDQEELTRCYEEYPVFRDFLEDPTRRRNFVRWNPQTPTLLPFTARLLVVIIVLLESNTPDKFPSWFADLVDDDLAWSVIRNLASCGMHHLVVRALEFWTITCPYGAFLRAADLGAAYRNEAILAIQSLHKDPLRGDPRRVAWMQNASGQGFRGDWVNAGIRRLFKAIDAQRTLAGMDDFDHIVLRRNTFMVDMMGAEEVVEEREAYWTRVAKWYRRYASPSFASPSRRL